MWIKKFFLDLQRELVFHVVMSKASDLLEHRNMVHKKEPINFKGISIDTLRIAYRIIEVFLDNDKVHLLWIYKQVREFGETGKYSFYIEKGVNADEYDRIRNDLNENNWSENDLVYVLSKAGLNATLEKFDFKGKVAREIKVRC